MQKRKKIKRYNYGRSSRIQLLFARFSRVLLAICILSVAAFIGWSLYEPVYDFVMGLSIEDIEPHSSIASSEEQSNSSSEESSGPIPSSVLNAENNYDNVLYLDIPTILDPELLSAEIASAHLDGITAVALPIKDSGGAVHIPSNHPYASSSVSGEVNEYLVGINTLKSEGFTLIGRINAFDDSAAARQITDENITYLNSGYSWVDTSLANGGTQWLNPYSDKAGDYIKTLSLEAANLGMDAILLESFHFPRGEALETANYGTIATASRDIALAELSGEIETALSEVGATLFVHTYAVDIMYHNNMLYGAGAINAVGEHMWLDLSLIGVVKDQVVDNDPLPVLEQLLAFTSHVDKGNSVAVFSGISPFTALAYDEEEKSGQIELAEQAGFALTSVYY